MIKRIISIGLTALLLMTVLVVLDVIPVEEVRGELNPPVWNPNGYYETAGDWVIQLADSEWKSDNRK
jgi:hypothetical protein